MVPAALAQSESPVISEMILHWETHDRRADGSDNWPVTWADDDHQYTSWGDGPGFDPNGDRMSLGFARVEGEKDNYQGVNLWGGPFDGKSYGIISIQGILYAWWGPGSGRTSYGETRMLISSDKGNSWTQSSWDFTDVDQDLIMPTILNFGKDNAGARDNYVYHYFIRKEPVDTSGLGIHKGGSPATGKIDLARVPNDQLMDIAAYEFFAGLDGAGDPTWSSDASQRVPVFEDSNGVGWNLSANYNAGLGRYMLMTQHTAHPAGLMGLFDAPEPWGPWTTIEYHDTVPFGDGHVSDNTFFWTFSNKWASADGLDFVMIFSGINSNDTWNTVEGTFVLRNPDDTPPSVPGGLNASAQGEDRIDLSWSAASDPDSGVSAYRVYRDGVNVGQPTVTTFSDTGLVEGTTYAYTVSAVNGAGLESAETAAVSESTSADTTPPSLVSAATTGAAQVSVVFSEALESGSAATASNYGIDNGVAVTSASLAADLVTVTLTTSTLAENVDYTLTVNNVRDRATSPNSIESNSTIAFQLVNVVTLDQRIASGADDVEEGQDGGMIPASSDLELVVNSGDVQTVGLRYDLPIPQGATIVNAYVQFQVDEVSTGAASLSIEAHASDDAPAFTSTNGDLASRPRTSASTAWVPAAWPTVGAQGLDQRTPNIASVLQEIVDRPGWTAGNSLVLILGGSGTRIAEAYNGDSTAAALLHVEYGPAAAAAPPLPPENPQVR
jgi:hypothetical protein